MPGRTSGYRHRTSSHSLIVSDLAEIGHSQRTLTIVLMRAAVITVSDSCFRGQRVDVSGTVVADLLRANAVVVISHLVVPDEQEEIEDALRQQCAVANLVVTTGGTGIAPRDVTPGDTRVVR